MQMHWCTCKFNQAGQGYYIQEIYYTDPVSWPEVQVLSAIHGEENVFDVKPLRISETAARMEKERLAVKYGWENVERVFPGRSFRMEGLMPGETTDQPRADNDGDVVDPDDQSQSPPTEAPVFKPGKPRPGLASP